MATYWENSCSFGLRYVSWYEYLIVSLFFSHLGFWSGNLFLIAPFPDLCLLVPLHVRSENMLKYHRQSTMLTYIQNYYKVDIINITNFPFQLLGYMLHEWLFVEKFVPN